MKAFFMVLAMVAIPVLLAVKLAIGLVRIMFIVCGFAFRCL